MPTSSISPSSPIAARSRASEVFRRERLLWVTSNRHSTHLEEPLPLALGRPSCGWRRAAIECLETIGRPHRIALHQRQRERGRVRGAVGAGGFGVPGIGLAARHARAQPRRRLPGIAGLPRRPRSAIRTKASRSPTRSPSTSSRRSTICRRRHRRRSRRAALVRVFVEHRLDRAVPRPVVLLQQLLGRRDAARDDLLQRPQIARLVAAVAVEPLAPRAARFAPARSSPRRDRACSGRGSSP